MYICIFFFFLFPTYITVIQDIKKILLGNQRCTVWWIQGNARIIRNHFILFYKNEQYKKAYIQAMYTRHTIAGAKQNALCMTRKSKR